MPIVLRPAGHVDLPAHRGRGGFDHAAVHTATGRVYVAHTANDAVDVFDPVARKHLFLVPGLPGVAGALVSDEAELVFTSNRAENTVGIFRPGPYPAVTKINVGIGPNGLAYDHERKLLLVANVGDPEIAGSHTVTMVSLDNRAVRAEIVVPGRTRWAVFDAKAGLFFVNIANPAVTAVVDARKPDALAYMFAVPAAGPHGLDFDAATRRLFCACDAGVLVALDARSGKILAERTLSGVPDVVFFNAQRHQLYVAVGDPGVIDVFDTSTMERLATVETERGAHTFAFAPDRQQLHAFLPQTHRAAIYDIGGG